MQKVPIGTRVKPLGINRTNVADGTKQRAILIDPSPRVKYIAWDDVLGRKVEVDQDMLIKYKLRPMTNFFYLIAKLNTDMNGTIVNDQFVIEYLQLSENVNNEFSDAVSENPNFSSLLLTKVSKKGPSGKDFSYVKVTPSTLEVPQEISQAINKLRSDSTALESIWTLIDQTTSMSGADYEAYRNTDEAKQKLAAAGVPAIEASKPLALSASPVIQDPSIVEFNDFAGDDDFSDSDFS